MQIPVRVKSFILVLFLLLQSCGKEGKIVARFGAHRITLEEFSEAYLEVLKQPSAFDSPQLREQFLDELIDRRLLADEARRVGLANDERLKFRVEAFRQKNMRDAHYRRVIEPRITYDEADVRKVFAFANEKRHIRHLFCETKEQADSLYSLLEHGVPFTRLAGAIFPESALSESGGDLGWVDWEQMEYDLAMTAYTLPLGRYSKPVRSSYGFHILQVIDWKKNPMLSEQEYELKRKNARAMLENKLGEKVAHSYVEKMMQGKAIKVYPKTLRAVGEQLGSILRRSPSPRDRLREEQLSDSELSSLENHLWELRKEPLASVDGRLLTVGEFIAGLNYIPYYAVHRRYKTALDYALRDFVLTQEARDLGLEKEATVRVRTNLYEESLLQMAMRQRLLQNVRMNDDELREYFRRHYAKLDADEKFAAAKEVIRRQALQEKKTRVLQEAIQQSRERVRITKNLQLIHDYYDEMHDALAEEISEKMGEGKP